MMATEDKLFICLRLAKAAKKQGFQDMRRHYVQRAWMHRASLRKS